MTRSRQSAKAAGTRWESAIVAALKAHGWPHAERRRLAGARDRGDIAGVVGVVIEAKDHNRLALAEAVDQATTEAANDGAAIGAAWLKRRGKPDAADGYVVLTGATFMTLLREAGYQ